MLLIYDIDYSKLHAKYGAPEHRKMYKCNGFHISFRVATEIRIESQNIFKKSTPIQKIQCTRNYYIIGATRSVLLKKQLYALRLELYKDKTMSELYKDKTMSELLTIQQRMFLARK